jgi:hypothetical protein
VEGYEETTPKIVLRSQVDAGPPKVRRRFTSGIAKIVCRYTLPPDLLQVLDDFYFSACAGGAVAFEWTHPRRLEPVMVRFLEPPVYKAFHKDAWSATVTIEVLPPGLAAALLGVEPSTRSGPTP